MRHFLGLPTSYMGLLLLMCPTSLAKAIKLKKKGRAQALCVRSIKKAWADALAYSKFESVCSWSTTCTSGRLRPTWTNCQYCSRELCGKLFTIMRMMPSNHCCEHSYFGKKKMLMGIRPHRVGANNKCLLPFFPSSPLCRAQTLLENCFESPTSRCLMCTAKIIEWE